MAKYIWSVPAWTGINQLFGSDPASPYNPPGGHTGIDFGTPMGTPLVAVAPGRVLHAGWFYGEYYDNPWLIVPDFAGIGVVIDHGEVITVTAHMGSTDLNEGDWVVQGQIIGKSGNTASKSGATFGPHTHFETLPDGWSVNNGTYGRVNPNLYCTGYIGVADATIITPANDGAITPLEEMDIDMATPKEVVEALLNHKLTIDGQEARFQDWFVAIVKDSKKSLKGNDVIKSFDGTQARVVEILANVGADVRAIKNKTDKLK